MAESESVQTFEVFTILKVVLHLTFVKVVYFIMVRALEQGVGKEGERSCGYMCVHVHRVRASTSHL